jgi:hypothetical protein
MEPVGVDENPVSFAEREDVVIYMVCHFSFQNDDKFKVLVPMTLGAVPQKI